MKVKIYLFFLLNICVFGVTFSQNTKPTQVDSGFFNYAYWNGLADKLHFSGKDRIEFIEGQKREFALEMEHLAEGHSHEKINRSDIVWVPAPFVPTKGYGQNTTNGTLCNNVDFENGNMNGWRRSTGFHPSWSTGCCLTPNGNQAIMTGGTDVYGGFPKVFPGGSFSVRLGDSLVGKIADRIEQTFIVTPANANFTYRYAVVLNDNNHAQADQPAFAIEMIDSLTNALIPCTVYTVAAASGVPDFTTSTLSAYSAPVRCKQWTNVALDLTPVIGSTVTIRFTVYDCLAGGHFGYAYIDGLCTSFATSSKDTTCPNIPFTMCAPVGFATTTWFGPGLAVAGVSTLCINPSFGGTYSCVTVLVPGCPGPTFVHTLTTLPPPILSFTPSTSGVCATQYSFTSSMSITPGSSIISHIWKFGDGSTSTATNPVHNYTTPGTYQIKLFATSNRGCVDSVSDFITIFPPPNLVFSPPSNCVNTVVQFTNTSNIGVGTITGYTWTLGNGPTSNLINPTNTYLTNGTYTITLTGISNQGCMSNLTQTLGIFPPPVVSFSAAPLCDINGTSFTPATSTAIASGTLATYLWNFGDGGTSTLPNPTHVYLAPGIYTVNLFALSDHNCPATLSNTFLISPSPTVAFATTSVHACSQNFTFTNNSAISSGPITFTWSFQGAANTVTTTALSPPYIFPSVGDYTVKLIGTSSLGCTDTAFQYISVYPYPNIFFDVPASCESAIFTVTTTATSGSVTSYIWDFGDPASGAANTSTLQNPTHFYSSTNTYTISLNLVSNLNCPSVTNTIITVYPNPVAAFSYSTINSCALPITFTNSSSTPTIGGSVISSYSWSFSPGVYSSLQNPGTINFPSNGTYSVSLIATTNHNCTDTMIANILVHPFPNIAFTVTPECVNLPVNIISTSSISPIPSVAGSITSYTLDFGDSSFSSVPTLSSVPVTHTYSQSGTHTLNFSATSNMGCTSNVTHTVQIYPVGVGDFSISANTCLGVPVIFTSTSGISSGTIYTTKFNFGDGTISYFPTTAHTYSTSGTFPVNFSLTTNNECGSSFTKTITVHPLPVVSFTANGGCLGTPSVFDPTVTIPIGTINTYTWNFGDANTSNNQIPSNTYILSGMYTPTLSAMSNQGCIGKGTNTVVINPLPNIAFSPNGACVNTSIQFTNTSNIISGTVNSYTWNFGGGNTSNLTSPTNSYNTYGVYTVTLGATSNLGCAKTTTNSLTIHPYPQLTVSPVYNSCINDSAQINTNINIPVGAIQSYSIFYGDGAIKPLSSISASYIDRHKYIAYGTFSLSLYAISNNGCALSKDTTIKVYPKPFTSFGATKFCYGSPTAFTNSSNIPAGYTIDEHLWNFGDGTPTSTVSNPAHTFIGTSNTFTTYPVSLTEISYPEGINGPISCSFAQVKTVTIYPHPVADFSTTSVCLGKPTLFTNLTPTLNTFSSWFQYNNGALSSIALNPIFTYSAAGTFTASLIANTSFGCTDTMTHPVIIYENPKSGYTTNNHCLGLPSIFTQTTTFTDGAESQYIWTLGTTTIGLQSAPAPGLPYTFTLPGTYSVSLTSISDLGCSNKYTSTITVYPLPTPAFFAPESCLNKATQFTNLSLGSNNTYTWTFGDLGSGGANSSNANNPSHMYTNSGSYTTNLQVTNDKNCTATTASNVIIHGKPTAMFSNTAICAGDKVAFNNLSTSPDGTLTSNLWDFNGDNVFDKNEPNPSYTYSLSGNYQLTLLVGSQFGCTDTLSRQLFINPKAVGVIAASKRNGCPGLCIEFTNTSSITTGSFTSSWDFGDDEPTTTALNPTRCFGKSGTYDITLTLISDIGCVTNFVNPDYISAFPAPQAAFLVNPEQIDEDDPVITVTNKASEDANFIRYYVNDGSSFGTRNFTHYIKNLKQTKPMVVQVVKNQYGCSDTTFQVLDIKPAYVVYFPNVFTPNGDGTNDDFRPKGVGIVKFTMNIYDRWGHQVFHTDDMSQTWDGSPDNSGDGAIKEDIYTWKAQVTDIFNKNHFLVGHVSVIR
ncbi:PKD domain-containing protein [Aurantibacillus circumpalustris]|uniref:PKD domain-containing protein n=1 Tax=Aurantibacillus circumpalustris TaxID=3036359 RepID=UPI00295BC9A5|nr:PKD domain-containing protein [Aurantibacillus circumpalustris]